MVTGGASGIGYALADRLSANASFKVYRGYDTRQASDIASTTLHRHRCLVRGIKLVLSDGNPEALAAAEQKLSQDHSGGEMICVAADVRREEDVQSLLEACQVGQPGSGQSTAPARTRSGGVMFIPGAHDFDLSCSGALGRWISSSTTPG